MFFRQWDKLIKIANSTNGLLSTQKALLSGIDTFLRRPSNVTQRAPHVRDATDLKRFMMLVVVGLIPCTLFGIWNTGSNAYLSIGYQSTFYEAFLEGLLHVLPLIIISYTAGGICETIFAQARKHEIAEGFLVTGLLYPLICPATIPWWIFIIGIVFGVIIGKEVFGGTGMNIVNPALLSRAFLFFAYPAFMSGDDPWIVKPFSKLDDGTLIPSNWTTIAEEKVLTFINDTGGNIDAITGQTPLALATNIANNDLSTDINEFLHEIYSTWNMFIGNIPGSIGETSTLMCLIGGCILLFVGVASWRIMLSVVVGAYVTALIFNYIATPDTSSLMHITPIDHIVMGGFAFGMIFMATDPVTSPLHNISKFIYGISIGALCILIRTINPAYPEGMMLSILFMNIFSPFIDHYVIKYFINKRKEGINRA